MLAPDQKQTILIVDDTPENIDVLAGVLSADYKIRFALNGEKALEIAHSPKPPDLILLDVMMPKMDGYEVCTQLKASFASRQIPVIFVTALTEVDCEARGLEMGAVDYITKPISPSIVRARVKTHLALYDQNRDLEQKVQERTLELQATRLEIIRRLGLAAEYKDNETGLHVMRMSHYVRMMANTMGLSQQEADLIYHAAPMHDIGKIGIPDHILLKEGGLTPQEWEVMKTHTIIGANIIGNHPSELIQAARVIALTHHEKWNGTGYPRGLAGEQIPLYGRIAMLMDVFDALTSNRPYKIAWTAEAAAEWIAQESGEFFDPALVPVFLQILPEMLEVKETFTEENFHDLF